MAFQFKIVIMIIFVTQVIPYGCVNRDDSSQEEQGLVMVAGNLKFAEGPAYFEGDLYFSDIDANRIYRWNKAEGLDVFMENSGRANGLYFNKNGNLLVCQGGNKRIISINHDYELNIISDNFNNNPYNEPNDIWISPAGNIYFTDPVFTGNLSQDGQYIYCVLAASAQVIKVADDLVKPNGITGNKEGSILYIADYGSSKIYNYAILEDGTITDKQLFATIKADGLDTDNEGNLYAASSGIMVYNSAGDLINTIQVPGTTTNSCIVEEDARTIYITTHNCVYKQIIN